MCSALRRIAQLLSRIDSDQQRKDVGEVLTSSGRRGMSRCYALPTLPSSTHLAAVEILSLSS